MDLGVEAEVWRLTTRYFSSKFVDLLGEALLSYRRLPGYAPPTRMHVELLGEEGIDALAQALCVQPYRHVEVCSPDYIQLRSPLRSHLCRYLLRYLCQQGRASDALLEAHLALEVGL